MVRITVAVILLSSLNGIDAGQDPTPQPNQATGMAFSLKPGVDPRTVPSVFNMLVELKWEGFDVGLSNGDLTPWQDQGVLFLNAALTVQQKHAGSHQGLWEHFTKLLVKYISNRGLPLAWILWGDKTKMYAKLIQKGNPGIYIKTGGHPSSQSATGFFGGSYFRCANDFLNRVGHGRIDWHIPPPRPEHSIEEIRVHAEC